MNSPFPSRLSTWIVGLTLAGFAAATPSAFSQTLTIVGGQGQIIAPSQQVNQPLKVLLVDANGNPMANQPITFTVQDYNGAYVPINPLTASSSTPTYITGSDGTASASFTGANIGPLYPNPYDQAMVVATAPNGSSVTFYETTSNINQQGAPLITPNFSSLLSLNLTGTAGSTAPNPILIPVNAQTNGSQVTAAVANVALTLQIDPSSTGTISCKEGPIVLTNASGVATCTPAFGKVGTGFFTVTIGGAFNSQQPIYFTVTVGPPALITITSGNNQTGNPGQLLPQTLAAVVTDLGGNPTPGIPMTFTSVTPGGATFTSVRTTTDSTGKVSASAILGSVPGVITIKLADNAGLIPNPAIFTETVNLQVTGLAKSSGDGQSAFVNTQFPQPLVVMVNTSNNLPASGLTVNFAVTSGPGSVVTSSATVSGNSAQTLVQAGATPGPIVVTASINGQYTVTFNLTAIPLGPSNLTFTNGASGATNSLSPGSIVTVYGQGLATNIQGVTSAFSVGPLPNTLAGVTAQIPGPNGAPISAPLYDIANVANSQFLTFQVPREVPVGNTTITIAIGGGGSTTVPITVAAASPGFFTYTGTGNQQYLVCIKSNGTVASPTNPATRGETVTAYLTGLPLTPNIATNAFPAPGTVYTAAYPVILGIANQGIPFIGVAYSPDQVGVETITFVVPTSTSPGAATVSLGVQTPAGTVYTQGVTLNIQ